MRRCDYIVHNISVLPFKANIMDSGFKLNGIRPTPMYPEFAPNTKPTLCSVFPASDSA